MDSITVDSMMKSISEIEKGEKTKHTLLGIGPMSLPVIRAAFELAKEKEFPLIFIASRNQIDTKELGGGYVKKWDQHDFVQAIKNIALEIDFKGIYYICRDHGGPWQRDNEFKAKLPEPTAMELAKKSYLADLVSGFDLLHIDPTKDPHIDGAVPLDLVIGRTVELIEYIEKERTERKIRPIAYEVGTEETNGGLTSYAAYSSFIDKLVKSLQRKNLPLPSLIVGQTGTLTRLTQNVGNFNDHIAQSLSMEAKKHGMGLKEHNADYLSDFVLMIHPLLGISASNIAPEFGVVETSSYLQLAEIEKYACSENMIGQQSEFVDKIKHEAVYCGRWRKWMVDDKALLTSEEVLKDEELASLITETGGHYTFEEPSVKEEMHIMFKNLESIGIQPERITLDNIKRSLMRYVEFFNLEGLTEKLNKKAS